MMQEYDRDTAVHRRRDEPNPFAGQLMLADGATSQASCKEPCIPTSEHHELTTLALP